MANHTQTGSISFEATNAASLRADGQYESLSDDLRDNYYTKSEFTVAPDKILSTVKEHAEQSARPNLTPWFSVSVDDTSYWAELHTRNASVSNSEGLHGIWDGEDGWAHITLDSRTSAGNDGSKSCYMNMHVAHPKIADKVTAGEKYTWLIEVKNLTWIAGASGNALGVRPSVNNATLDVFNTCAKAFTEDGAQWGVVTAKSDLSVLTTRDTRGYCYIPTGCYADFDLRISLYEGEYSGPYKPYVDQSLITRVSTAETAIEQNAEEILLRATKTEAQQMAQPNLAPITAAPLDSVYNATTNPNGYWKTTPASWFTSLEDGWVHVERDNTEGTGAANTTTWRPRPAEGIVAGGVYTILTEIRNNHSTVSTVGSYDIYLQQQANNQFWGNVEQIVPGSPDDGTSTTTTVSLGKCGESYVLRSYRIADAEHLSGDPAELFRYNFRLPKGCKFDFDIRQSVYAGIYDGPYKPYVGAQLYASQAQLKVANDEIDLRVEKSGVIAAINASTEAEGGSAVKIQADKVQIDGTTTFTSGTTLADYVEGKAQDAADSVVVGGTNLLRSSGVWEQGTWRPSTGAHIASTTRLRSSKDGWYVPVEPNATYVIGRHAVDSSVDYYVVLYAYDSSGAFVLTDSVTAWITSFPYTYVPATATRLEVGICRSDNTNISVSEAAAARLKLERGNKPTDWTPAPEDVTSRTQRIYYRTSSSTAPTSQYMPTAWVTETGDKWAANSTTVANWTAKATKLTNGSGTKYPYLFTCEQRQMGDGTLAYTTVLLDETTTVIDGGSIITNSIDANKLTVYDATIGKIKADAIDVSAIKIGDLDGASTVVSNASNGKSAYDRHTAYRGTCSTAAGTAAKVVACTGFALATGATVEVYCSTANTANVPTLNVNSTGNKPIWINGAVASASNPCKWLAGDTVTFTYDGSEFRASLPVEGYVTEGTGGGLMVHRKSDATTGVRITDSVDVMRNGASVALFGTDGSGNAVSRIGPADSEHTEQTVDGFTVYTLNSTDTLIPAIKIQTSEDNSHEIDSRIYLYAERSNTYIDTENSPFGSCIYLCADNTDEGDTCYPGVGLKADDRVGLARVLLYKDDTTSGKFVFRVDADQVRFPSSSIESDALKNVPTTKITGTLDTDHIPNMNASKIISGVFAEELIPDVATSKLYGTIADSNLPTKGSAGTAGTSSATSGATLAVPYVTTDAYGRVTAKGTHTHTIGSLAASAVTTGEFDAARIPNLDASKINAGTFDAARIPSLNASKINAGTFNAARIPNLNASKINAGTLDSARLPTVPVDKGGTGQTGVTTVTTVASFIAAASGVTVSSVRVTVWGKLVHAYVMAKPDAAKTAAWVVGTVVDAYRPNAVVTGKPYYTGVDSARIQTNGTMQITACGAVEVGVSFTYLLA